MNALEYRQWQQTFEAKARNATDDEISFTLTDIRQALAIRSAEVLEGDDYVTKLLLERDEYLVEAGRRCANEYLTRKGY